MDCATKRPWQGPAERAQRICDLDETQGTQNANTTSEETTQILWDSSSPAISTYTGQLAGKNKRKQQRSERVTLGRYQDSKQMVRSFFTRLEKEGQATADCTSSVHGLINRVDRTDIFRKHMPVRLQGDQGTLTGRYSQGNSPRQDRKVFSDQCMTSFLLWQRPELRLVLRNCRIFVYQLEITQFRKSPQTILFGHFFISDHFGAKNVFRKKNAFHAMHVCGMVDSSLKHSGMRAHSAADCPRGSAWLMYLQLQKMLGYTYIEINTISSNYISTYKTYI